MLPLANKRIVVTRPHAQADDLSAKLKTLGAQIIRFPVIEISQLDDYSALDAAIHNLPNYDWVVFTSVNGVEAFWSRCQQPGVEPARPTSNVAAIGPATAAALRAHGIQSARVPLQYVADTLVADLGEVRGQRFLLVRAELARETLPEGLRARGALVEDVPAYRTVPVSPESAAFGELEIGIDMITFTSSSAITSFVALMRQANIETLYLPVACLGPVTAATARQAGFVTIITAAIYSTDGLVSAIITHYTS